jgi:hypothetical protein
VSFFIFRKWDLFAGTGWNTLVELKAMVYIWILQERWIKITIYWEKRIMVNVIVELQISIREEVSSE